MSNKVSSQATKLWQLISAPSTAETYKLAGVNTWNILKETVILAWLVICLVLVVFDWIGTGFVVAKRRFQAWLNSFQQTSTDKMASETGKALLDAGKTGIVFAVAQAREQLGLPEKQPLPEPELVPATSAVPAPSLTGTAVAIEPEKKPVAPSHSGNIQMAEAPSTTPTMKELDDLLS